MNPFSDILTALLGIGIIFPAFFMLGSVFRDSLSEDDLCLSGIYAWAIGAALFMLYVFFIGSFGFFTKPFVLSFFLGVWILRRRALKQFALWFKSIQQSCSPAGLQLPEKIHAYLFLLSAALLFVFCFFPEIANDALCYQLNLPRRFVAAQGTLPIASDANSYMPIAFNYLYATAMMFQSVSLAKLFHFLSGVLLTFAIMRSVKKLAENQGLAVSIGTLFFLMPLVVNEMAVTYVDIAAAFFLFLSLLLFLNALKQRLLTAYLLSGVLMGTAIAIKFFLLIALGAIGLVALVEACQTKKFKELSLGYVWFGAGCFLTAGVWFLRNFILVGNPLFPYFGEIFGTIGLQNYQNYLSLGVEKNLLNFLTVLVPMTFAPKLFGWGHWIGPFCLLTVPAFLRSFSVRQVRPHVIFTAVLFAAWFAITQLYRYLLPVLPGWYVVAAVGLIAWQKKLSRPLFSHLARGAGVLMAFFLFLILLAHYRIEFRAIGEMWTGQKYIAFSDRSYPAASWANQNLPPGSKILSALENRPFYFDQEIVREDMYHLFNSGYADDPEPRNILSRLKGEGFTHILLAHDKAGTRWPERYGWIQKAVRDPSMLTQLTVLESENQRDPIFQYAFYRID